MRRWLVSQPSRSCAQEAQPVWGSHGWRRRRASLWAGAELCGAPRCCGLGAAEATHMWRCEAYMCLEGAHMKLALKVSRMPVGQPMMSNQA